MSDATDPAQQTIADPEATLSALRERRAANRKQPYRPSRLDPHRAELVALRRAGASLADLADWLRRERRTRVARSTIQRALRRWPESPDYAGVSDA